MSSACTAFAVTFAAAEMHRALQRSETGWAATQERRQNHDFGIRASCMRYGPTARTGASLTFPDMLWYAGQGCSFHTACCLSL